jgi:hypothetical protein
MTTTNTPANIVRAETRSQAKELAEKAGFSEEDWFFIPLTLTGDPSVYVKRTSPESHEGILADLSLEEQEAVYLNNERQSRLLLAADFWSASRYAADRSWWLHAWSWVELPVIEDVVEYQKLPVDGNADSSVS